MPGVGTRNVVLVAFEDVRLLNVTGPLEVFDLANTILRSEGTVPYRPMVVSRPGGAIRTSGVKIYRKAQRSRRYRHRYAALARRAWRPRCRCGSQPCCVARVART